MKTSYYQLSYFPLNANDMLTLHNVSLPVFYVEVLQYQSEIKSIKLPLASKKQSSEQTADVKLAYMHQIYFLLSHMHKSFQC